MSCAGVGGLAVPSAPAFLVQNLSSQQSGGRQQRGMRDRAFSSMCDAEATAAQSRSDRNSSTILLL